MQTKPIFDQKFERFFFGSNPFGVTSKNPFLSRKSAQEEEICILLRNMMVLVMIHAMDSKGLHSVIRYNEEKKSDENPITVAGKKSYKIIIPFHCEQISRQI